MLVARVAGRQPVTHSANLFIGAGLIVHKQTYDWSAGRARYTCMGYETLMEFNLESFSQQQEFDPRSPFLD